MTFAIELSQEQSRRILEGACRTQHDIRLLPSTWSGGKPISCMMVHVEDDGLVLKVKCLDDADFKDLLNIYCHLDLDLEDGQYFFDTNIIAVRQNEDGIGLTLGWPDNILVKQRRRSSRHALAQSSAVQLSTQQGDRLETFAGRLYNLSEEGLAFQLAKADAEKLTVGQTCCACFEVPEQEHTYRFEGVICRTLPSSSQNYTIIGIQFESSTIDQGELEHLREYLIDRSHSSAVMGGMK